jgi:hypothetical protein
VSGPQPLTGDELAAIKARAEDDLSVAAERSYESPRGVLRLVAEVERLRATVERVETVHARVEPNGERHPSAGHKPFCGNCDLPWPCGTVRALEDQ